MRLLSLNLLLILAATQSFAKERTVVVSPNDTAPTAATAPVATDESRPNLSVPTNDQSRMAIRRSEHRIEEITNHWYAGIGNVWSSAMIGSGGSNSAGTKLNIELGYTDAFAEHFDYIFFFDSSLNTDTLGKSDVNIFGVGAYWQWFDRLSSNSPFLRLDAGYGGVNRSEDSSAAVGAGIGMQFLRNNPVAFEVILRYQVLLTQNVTAPVGTNPSVTQLRVGAKF